MAANAGLLAGKTLFITGASRGIGKAIALKAASDGANVVIAAKTTEPHPKLPGTIYTAAKEVEEAGGKALACAVDIRFEDSVKDAMKKAEEKFGGIDILVNNASAISLTDTQVTDMKRYDLMMGINGRGTYMCSKFAIPYLQKSSNPHILNISPPLNMNQRWFKDHVAYTMAKYGMSMCVLGMSAELRPDSIAVNALWPRTAIYTAAMEMLGGGEGVAAQCRKPEIMSDAAYIMLTKNSREYTGNFAIDDEVLKAAGVTDMEQYSCVPGSKLLPDFFLDGEGPQEIKQQMQEQGGTPAFSGDQKTSSSGSGPAATFAAIKGLLNEDLVSSMNGSFQFNLSVIWWHPVFIGGGENLVIMYPGRDHRPSARDDAGTWYIDLKTGSGSVGQGEAPGGASCTMTLDSDDFVKMFKGEMKAVSAFMSGKLKIQGDMALAMKLEKLMNKMEKSKL